jgi:signal transduction histidine kinase
MVQAYSVLIIDDSEDDIDLYLRLLRTDPFISEVRTAETGAEGLASYEVNPSDCVLLDYNLPGCNGFEVLRQIRERDRHAAVIMLTGQGTEEQMTNAARQGASDYILKDKISVASLRRAVRNAIIKSDLLVKVESQREAQEKFLQKLTHDLRAPLRHASRFAEFLSDDLTEGRLDEAAPYPAKIRSAINRANGLIDALASYLRVEREIELDPVSLKGVVDAAIGQLQPLIEDRHAKITVDPLPTVRGARQQLVQLFQHLITNAVQYNGAAAPEVKIEATRLDSDHWRISVSDNGPGIPADLVKEIFEPLRRLYSHDKIEGAGLGLAICRRIAETHGGEIWCESELGKGSVFHLTLAHAVEAV